MALNKAVLKIEGMHCAACSSKVERSLQKLEGVDSAQVNLTTEKAYVSFSDDVNIDDIKKQIEKVGYKVIDETEKITVDIEGMHCAACSSKVERVLNKKEGIGDATVNLALNNAVVSYTKDLISTDEIIVAIEKLGYKAKIKSEHKTDEVDKDEKRLKDAKNKMIWAWAFTAPAAVWMLIAMSIGGHNHGESTLFNIAMVLLSAPVLFWVGSSVFTSAYNSVRHGSANMDVLIAIGTLAAFITGILVFIVPIENYAGVAGMIMAFHLTGRYIETKAKGRASQAIKSFWSSVPRQL